MLVSRLLVLLLRVLLMLDLVPPETDLKSASSSENAFGRVLEKSPYPEGAGHTVVALARLRSRTASVVKVFLLHPQGGAEKNRGAPRLCFRPQIVLSSVVARVLRLSNRCGVRIRPGH